uniref:Pyridine nucleotide-disulphide oxidoreductase N-terminal domain-containing protein n=1 Tax=Alexandrium monilatum TaxID=311494 RepID=A0A7S4WA74_9DINO
MALSDAKLEELAEDKAKDLKTFLAAEPPKINGESLLALWERLYDETMRSIVVETLAGPSDDATNPVFPYEKLVSVIGDGGNWKWPRMWQRFDELERRGPAYREGEELNFGQPNKNPNILPQRVLVVGGGPVGLRLAIELVLGGHKVTIFEKRREIREDETLQQLGFTNRINRPHMWPFVRNDLAKLNGRDFMSREACYPVFTEPDTSSIGIDELQILLLKNALMLGVDFRLGVGYSNAKVGTDPKSMRPFWNVDCSYDAKAAAKFGRSPGQTVETFDVIMGCDGPRSTVRETQAKLFGNIEKRKFMDCVGIVANVRKVPRSRLKALGFEFGQEPKDMNRTRMLFKDFFKKIEGEADAELENLIYYKASFHNYCILTPKRQDLRKHGLSGKVYTFAKAREQAGGEADDEKAKLKEYCRKVLKAAGIPVDETLENGGFVDAPNDVMAFDFAECWNTPKSISFNLPPADYDTEQHGEWMGRRLVPMVGLAGDALLEPFWPMGLGLKRGWQAIMDACYCIDNLYNRTLFAQTLGKEPRHVTWDDHYEALQAQVAQNFEYCSRLKVGEELGKGEYSDKGIIMQQLRKITKDVEKPPLEVEIDPWTRYAPLEEAANAKIRQMPKAELEKFQHPKVSKALAVADFYGKHSKSGGRGEIDYKAKDLISVEGKVRGGTDMGGYKPRLSLANIKPPELPATPMAIPKEQVERIAQKKRDSLTQSAMAAAVDAMVQGGGKGPEASKRRPSIVVGDGTPVAAGLGSLLARGPPAARPADAGSARTLATADSEVLDQLALTVPRDVGDSVADASAAMWDRMHEKNLSPAQQAELEHVRNMITALEKSLQNYRDAERQLLLSSKK